MRYLTLSEVIFIHRELINQFGGSHGIRDVIGLDSAVSQPRMTYGGNELYPTVIEKAAALGYSLILNHPFIDGNKRIGHAAVEIFLYMNGFKLICSVNKQEEIILQLVDGKSNRAEFNNWIRAHISPSDRDQ